MQFLLSFRILPLTGMLDGMGVNRAGSAFTKKNHYRRAIAVRPCGLDNTSPASKFKLRSVQVAIVTFLPVKCLRRGIWHRMVHMLVLRLLVDNVFGFNTSVLRNMGRLPLPKDGFSLTPSLTPLGFTAREEPFKQHALGATSP